MGWSGMVFGLAGGGSGVVVVVMVAVMVSRRVVVGRRMVRFARGGGGMVVVMVIVMMMVWGVVRGMDGRGREMVMHLVWRTRGCGRELRKKELRKEFV